MLFPFALISPAKFEENFLNYHLRNVAKEVGLEFADSIFVKRWYYDCWLGNNFWTRMVIVINLLQLSSSFIKKFLGTKLQYSLQIISPYPRKSTSLRKKLKSSVISYGNETFPSADQIERKSYVTTKPRLQSLLVVGRSVKGVTKFKPSRRSFLKCTRLSAGFASAALTGQIIVRCRIKEYRFDACETSRLRLPITTTPFLFFFFYFSANRYRTSKHEREPFA